MTRAVVATGVGSGEGDNKWCGGGMHPTPPLAHTALAAHHQLPALQHLVSILCITSRLPPASGQHALGPALHVHAHQGRTYPSAPDCSSHSSVT